MPGVYDTSPLCLAALRRYIREPAAATGGWPQDADLYAMLTDAENAVKTDLAPRVPHVLVQQVKMATADGGVTYTFGTDAEGNARVPLGQVAVYAIPEDVPDTPLQADEEYVPEGDRIRMVGNVARAFPSTGPVARFVPMTLVIDATTAPSLLPMQARELVVIEAARRYGVASKQSELVALAAQDYQTALQRWLLAFATQYDGRGANAGGRVYRRGHRWPGAR